MTDTTITEEKPPPTDPRPPCEICESDNHTTGQHENDEPTGGTSPMGQHENSAGA